jgi:hypothetical protein
VQVLNGDGSYAEGKVDSISLTDKTLQLKINGAAFDSTKVRQIFA